MTYTCTVRNLASQPAMVIRCHATVEGVGPAMVAGFGAVAEFLRRSGAVPAGETYARYLHVGAETVDFEVGFTVRQWVPAEDPVEASELPAGEAVVTLHRGSYEQLPCAVRALEDWISVNGRQAAGPHWECYLNGPPDVTDPELYETEIFVPLE